MTRDSEHLHARTVTAWGVQPFPCPEEGGHFGCKLGLP